MKFVFILLFVLLASRFSTFGQNQMIDKVNLVDRSNSKIITLNKPSSLSSGLRLIFPSSAGAANQVLAISAVAGTDITLGWVTMSSGTSSTSKRLTGDQTVTPPAVPTGLVKSVSANSQYRVVATVRCHRVSTGSDNIKFKLSGPSGTTFVSIGVRCLDDNTTSPTYTSASTDNVTTGAIDPPDYNAHSYSIDALVVTGGSTGNITLTVVDGATPATTNDLTIIKHSNMVLREIE